MSATIELKDNLNNVKPLGTYLFFLEEDGALFFVRYQETMSSMSIGQLIEFLASQGQFLFVR